MAFGFCLAVATLVFVVLFGISRAVSADIKRGLGEYPTAPPDARPRPLIVTMLGWATVAREGLMGLLYASLFLGVVPWHSDVGFFLVVCSLLPLSSGFGAFRRARPFMALRAGGCEAIAKGQLPPAFTIVVTALFSALSLLRAVFMRVVRDTGGWGSPEALQAYAWVLLWMALAALIVILSTVITHGLQSEEVRRLFPEAQSLPQASASL